MLSRVNLAIALTLFISSFFIFLYSPIHQLTDSNYSMLLSQSLLQQRTFTLEHYAIPRQAPFQQNGWVSNGSLYQIEVIGNHLYYFFPPGTSVLSLPYVALMNRFGISAVNADGTYNVVGEERIQASLAALLMAALTVVVFFTSRMLLTSATSALVAAGGAFGTQIWSTASRAMWADTWSLLLLGVVILILLGHETGRVRFHGVLLASLLAWLYFVRPTNAIAIIGVSVYVLIFYKDRFIPFAVTGMLWEVCFAAYSWYHFRQLVPNYYRATRLSFASFGTALVGNLVSPSRGLLIYVPVLLFIIYLLVRYYAYVFSKRLVVLAVAVVVGHLIVISGFSPWHGGGAYGPRYSAPLVPWFVLLGILGLHAMLTWREGRGAKINLMRWRTSIVFGCLMLVVSVFINARGAISPETWKWNGVPVSTDEQPDRVWDWRQPQFLAGYLPYPKPRDMPPVSDSRFRCGSQFEKYWWYGWFHEEARCWADSKATIVFSLEQPHELILRIRLSPFLVAGKITAQRLKMTLNDSPLLYLVISDATPQDYGVLLPRELLSERNVIELDMPDAASPQSVGLGSEQRRRSLLVQRIEFDTP